MKKNSVERRRSQFEVLQCSSVVIFSINTTSDISKLLYVIIRITIRTSEI